MVLAQVAEHGGYLRETAEILTDPAHITAELVIEILPGILLYPVFRRIGRRWLERHDRSNHGS